MVLQAGCRDGCPCWFGMRGRDEVGVEQEDHDKYYEEELRAEKFPPESAGDNCDHGDGEVWRVGGVW